MIDFLKDNWAVIALVTSEVISFLPTKVGGIAQTVFKVLGLIFSSKKTNELPSTKK